MPEEPNKDLSASLPPSPPEPIAPGGPALSPAQDSARKIAELEKRLQAEREKVLLANLKTQEEAAASARVEGAIKDVQERLRRDRRDADQEETRLRLETRIQDLENRLAQERETWVSTLKSQMTSREVQDREIETHFTGRIQEMERRWLEEKAHWQRVVLAKDEEIRASKGAQDRLKQVDLEHQRLLQEKRFLEERLSEFSQAQAALQAKVSGAAERERDYYQVKAELEKVRDHAQTAQDRLERDLESLRSSAREREERLASEVESLRRDIAAADQRARADLEPELRRAQRDRDEDLGRLRAQHEEELKKTRAQADVAGAALQRMRAVGAALEKQVAAMRVQLDEARRVREESGKANERFKAEFLMLQRKWQDREAEIRKQAADEAFRQLEADRLRMRAKAQEEIQIRVQKAEEELRRDGSLDMAQREQILRERIEREVLERLRRQSGDSDEARRKLEGELARKHEELERRDQAWQERLLKKESELLQMRSSVDDARSRSMKEDEWKAVTARERVELEKRISAQDAELGLLRKAVAESGARVAESEKAVRAFATERQAWDQMRAQFQAQVQAAAQKGATDFETMRVRAEEMRLKLEARERAAEDIRREADRARADAVKAEDLWKERLESQRRETEIQKRALEDQKRELESRARTAEAERDEILKAHPSDSSVLAMGRLKGLFKK